MGWSSHYRSPEGCPIEAIISGIVFGTILCVLVGSWLILPLFVAFEVWRAAKDRKNLGR